MMSHQTLIESKSKFKGEPGIAVDCRKTAARVASEVLGEMTERNNGRWPRKNPPTSPPA